MDSIRERIASEKLAGNSELYIVHHPTYGDILIKPLPLRVFYEIRDLILRGVITATEAEDLIFKKYVLDERMQSLYPQHLLAGDVSTIAQQIMAVSAPTSDEQLQEKLNYYTGIASTDVFEKLIVLICTAFPSYTPTQLEGMTWKEIVKLAARAQVMLIERGVLKKPLEIYSDPKGSPKKSVIPPQYINKRREKSRDAQHRIAQHRVLDK